MFELTVDSVAFTFNVHGSAQS